MGTGRVAVLAALTLVLGTVTAAAYGSMPLASFQPAPGWKIATAGPDNPSLVVAVTSPDVAAIHPVALFGSFRKLSRDGILVWAETVGRGRKGFPQASVWPARLTRFRVDHGWEGQPAPNIQQRVWVGSVNGVDLDLRVFFATQHPTSELLARAQAELNRIRLGRSGAADTQVAAGRFGSVAWSLRASDGSTGSYCVAMWLRGQQDAAGCGSIHSGLAHGVSYLASNGHPGPDYIAGPVDARATRVRVDLVGGQRLFIPTISAPRGMTKGIAFYVRVLRCLDQRPLRITGLDRNGHVVASLNLPRLVRPLIRTPPCA